MARGQCYPFFMALGLQINFYDRVIMITSILQQVSFIGKIMLKVWNYFALQLSYSSLKIHRLHSLVYQELLKLGNIFILHIKAFTPDGLKIILNSEINLLGWPYKIIKDW